MQDRGGKNIRAMEGQTVPALREIKSVTPKIAVGLPNTDD